MTIPAPLTPLVGRDHETQTVISLLTGDARLVTLTGPGGIGKTRLAIEVADRITGFPGGHWFVPLAPIRDARLVLPTIGQTLNLQETGDRPIDEQVRAFLGKRDALLILDNVEQIADLAPVIADLLDTAPTLKILVTSRSPLHISGEYEFPVSPLELPATDAALEHIASSDAVTLFLTRARATRPGFALIETNAAPIADICRRLDGLPLAIELAAARIKVLSPHALAARLSQGLTLLTGGSRDLPTRQQTLRNTIAWSYDLLTPDEQSLFRTLSVFAGGFTLEAAEAVAQLAPDSRLPSPDSVLDVITSLIDKSLLEVTDDPTGEPRYRLLETVREFGLEQLTSAGDLPMVRQSHAAWVASFTEGGEHHLSGPGEAAWSRLLTVELNNIRAALTWTAEQNDTETALRITGSISSFWAFSGHLTEGRDWLTRALAMPTNGVPDSLRAHALSTAGLVAWASADLDTAENHFNRALALHRTLGDANRASHDLQWLAQVAWYRGDPDTTWTLASEGIATAGPGIEPGWHAASHTMLAIAAMRRGSPESRALLERALALHQQGGFARGRLWTLQLIADLDHREGNLAASARRHRESLPIARDSGNQWALFEDFTALVLLAHDRGLHHHAARLMGAAATLSETSGVLPRAGHETYELATAAVRTTLGPDTFTAEFTTGRSLSLPAAVEEATATATLIANDEQPQPPTASPQPSILSPRELEVLRLFAAGHSDREIADILYISHGTARTHTRNILLKLGVNSRAAAVAYGLHNGLI